MSFPDNDPALLKTPGASVGEHIRVSLYGASHADAVGVRIDGLPAGEMIDSPQLAAFMERRAPGRNALSSPRKETDIPEFLSGVSILPPATNDRNCVSACAQTGKTEDPSCPACLVTTGDTLTIRIRNTDVRPSDYDDTRFIPRPGHADYPAYIKYGSIPSGGGVFSARMTAPLCAAGGILLQCLARRGIRIGAHIAEIAGIADTPFDPVFVSEDMLDSLCHKPFAVVDDEKGEEMQSAILRARADGDSVGGIVECAILGLPAGTGEPLFGSLDGTLAQIVFGIPAVRGIEFGDGFAASRMRGSEHNDPYGISGGKVIAKTNHSGGILGGLANGSPVIFRAAFKPTPSIARPQDSVDLRTMKNAEIAVRGRHDPCVALRAVPCVEAASALALAQYLL